MGQNFKMSKGNICEKMTPGVRLPPPWGNIDMLIKHLPLQKRMANPEDKSHTLRKLAHAINRDFLSFKIEKFQLKKMIFFLFLLKT